MTTRKQKRNLFFKFDKAALILGFVVDSITIISILFAINVSQITINLQSFISPGLAFSIWVISAYTYLALLHRYWENSEEFSKNSFSYFLFTDLLFHFKRPFFHFPTLVLVILLFWIAYVADKSGGLAGGLGALLFIVGFVTFMAFAMSADQNDEPITEEDKEKINTNWEFLKERIELKLSRNQWLAVNDLTEIAEVWQIPITTMGNALSKYAFECPDNVEYGYVYRRKDDELISGREPVLINLDEINRKRYYYSTR
jgi:hypothetical protein